ncbi:rhodanese-like domain-containing protein [uncultured Winogradskyella sp.]|uniref:rhodanese-like domain-containing protein n=1 Tax=uncultured Winogradskyella sp. TaxID=395353 RepID=UPI0026389E9C|nr:rhodanese-like domain-containing protein [uncultured Winogradskyella sp.]
MKYKVLYTLLFFTAFGFAQETLSELLKKYNSESIPYISVHELAMPKTKAILLDAREDLEYKTSHLKDAIHIGYDNFDISLVTKKIKDKSLKIVVYCSLGIRSEDIAEQLKEEGYTNVFNLFGGIFEWKNNDYKVYNEKGETADIHAFSKAWSKWLVKGNKVYSKDKKEND